MARLDYPSYFGKYPVSNGSVMCRLTRRRPISCRQPLLLSTLMTVLFLRIEPGRKTGPVALIWNSALRSVSLIS